MELKKKEQKKIAIPLKILNEKKSTKKKEVKRFEKVRIKTPTRKKIANN